MAQDTVNEDAVIAGLEVHPCRTEHIKIDGWLKSVDESDPLHCYGSDMIDLKRLINDKPDMGQKLHTKLHYLKGEIVWAVRKEMARTVEDAYQDEHDHCSSTQALAWILFRKLRGSWQTNWALTKNGRRRR